MLRLHFVVPSELVAKHPKVTIALNGKTLDSFRTAEQFVSRDYHVKPESQNVLELMTDQTIDMRGLKVRFISWGPG